MCVLCRRGKGRLTEEEKAAREAEKERKKQERIAARCSISSRSSFNGLIFKSSPSLHQQCQMKGILRLPLDYNSKQRSLEVYF